MGMTPIPARKPALMIAARYTSNPDNAKDAYELLYDLQPLFADGGSVSIQNTSNGREELSAKGDLKRFDGGVLRRFDEDEFLKVIDL